MRDVGEQVDGGSGSHTSMCKLFAAQLIVSGQADSLAAFLRQAKEDAGEEGLAFAISNMVFDETELDVALSGFGV